MLFIIPVNAGAIEPIKIGNFVYIETTDAITDQVRASATVEDINGNSTTLQCDAPGLDSVYPVFYSKKYLGGDGGGYDSRDLIIRFGTGPAVTRPWTYKGNIAFLHPGTGITDAKFFKQIVKKSIKLTIRAYSYESEQVDATFELSGVEDAIDRVQTTCKDGQ